ncbi:SAM-dependent methyltransferase [Salinispora arenicola]|uniref:Methyltransferase type 11 n=1 Tax=Salinispora arenicola (strain CNS-205) TaxID=391037 RepID=A8M6Z4_SALAI|nr:methyltransferase domain-containing protein [Salinispora arenicola]NIL56179.1 methyltransferase domain-containing protein [Salinispora arenicola]
MKKPTPNEIGQGYDAFADLLDQLWGVNLHHGYWEDASENVSVTGAANRLTDKLADLLTIEAGDRVLDLGCGIGEPAIRLATAHTIEVVGISISGRQVERAQERAVSAGLADRLSFELADAMDLPYPEESFDIVWALESLHHMPDRAHVLRQMTRVLRPGGRVAIGDFMLLPSAGGYEAGAARVNEASKGVLSVIGLDAYLAMIRAAGLVPVATEDVSKHTRPSWAKAEERFAALREQAVPHIGKEQFDLTLARFRAFSQEPALGYALLTAHKPA